MQIWGGGCYRRAEIAIPRLRLLRGKAQARQIGAHDDVAGESARLGSLQEEVLRVHPRPTIIRPDGDTEQFGELTDAEPRWMSALGMYHL
jgi:hypothetical protein